MFLKYLRDLIIIIISISVITLTGCKQNPDSMTSLDSRYEWLDDLHTLSPDDSVSDMLSWGMFAFIPKVNGHYNSEATYRYSEPELELTLQYSYHGVPSTMGRLMILTDGYIQPFYFEEESDELTVKELYLDKENENYVSAVRFTPIISKPNEPIYITFLFSIGGTDTLTKPSMSAAGIYGTGRFIIQLTAEGNIPYRNIVPETTKIVLSQLDEIPVAFQIGNLNNNDFRLYQEISAGESLVATLSKDPGDYRMILFIDGIPVPAFNGNLYMDYTVDSAKCAYYFILDSYFFYNIGTQLYNIWLLDYPQHIEIGSRFNETTPVTVRVLS